MNTGTSSDHTSPTGPAAPAVAWLRPEYQGREHELINLAEGAALVGVGRAAVSNWAQRHANFPELVLLTGSPKKRTKYVVRQEFLAFADGQRNKERRPRGAGPSRPRTQVAAEQTEHCEGVLRGLAEREERQVKALERTRMARRAAEERLATARARLDAEIAAVEQLGRGVRAADGGVIGESGRAVG